MKLLRFSIFFITIYLINSCSIGTSVIIRNYNKFPVIIKTSLDFKNERITSIFEVYKSDKIIENKDFKNNEFSENNFINVGRYESPTNEILTVIDPESTIFFNSYRLIKSIKFTTENGKLIKENKFAHFLRTGSRTYYYELK